MEQGTQEWLEARAGKVTASRMADVMAKGRSGAPSATRATYMGQLAAERLSGEIAASYTNAAMEWGTEHEPQARFGYEFQTDTAVEQIGMVDHPTIPMFSASPDGLVGASGLVEIKCPNSATHIQTLLGAQVDRRYLLQMQTQLCCTEREWCDFVSFDPRLPPEMQMHIKRVDRDDELIAEIEAAAVAFLNELDEMCAALTARYLKKAA